VNSEAMAAWERIRVALDELRAALDALREAAK
jgi:hypothetical protein